MDKGQHMDMGWYMDEGWHVDKEGRRPERVDMGTVDGVWHGWTRLQGRTCDRQRHWHGARQGMGGTRETGAWVRTDGMGEDERV